MGVRYQRVLLKIGGEAFCKEDEFGIDIAETKFIANEVLQVQGAGVQIAVVVGGGNFVRGRRLGNQGIGLATADYMGMLATLINALALQDILESYGTETRVLSAIHIQSVAEPFIRRRAIRHLQKGRIIILACGTGSPHFTTDTAAALRATEIGAEVLLKATKVDGVYTDDPASYPEAKKFTRLTYMDMLNQRLKIMDTTAISMCMEYKLPIIVFDLKKEGNIMRAISSQDIGTLICES